MNRQDLAFMGAAQAGESSFGAPARHLEALSLRVVVFVARGRDGNWRAVEGSAGTEKYVAR
jgi:hypothetical protein